MELAAIPAGAVLEARRKAADRPGRHFWVMAGAWRVSDPQACATGTGPVLMDAESLVMFTGPGCMKCEQPWSRKLERRPCRGTLE